MLQSVLSAFYDAVAMLLRHQVEKRSILENLDLVVLALDETIDNGSVQLLLLFPPFDYLCVDPQEECIVSFSKRIQSQSLREFQDRNQTQGSNFQISL